MNSEPKIHKDDNVSAVIENLSITERKLLSDAIRGHKRMKTAVVKIGRSKDTIAKAAAGMNITTETAEKIRTFLNTL